MAWLINTSQLLAMVLVCISTIIVYGDRMAMGLITVINRDHLWFVLSDHCWQSLRSVAGDISELSALPSSFFWGKPHCSGMGVSENRLNP